MLRPMFEECLYFNTVALARRLEREWVVTFKPFGLSPSQAFLLRTILNQPGLLQRELADSLAISRPTATRVLDGLEAKELIERRDSGRDGREYAIYPTRKASALQALLNEASGKVTRRLKKQLNEDVFAEAVSKVRGVRSALD
jgi:MarR family transcriptional regulator, temperature-dependent positive regulator of motility